MDLVSVAAFPSTTVGRIAEVRLGKMLQPKPSTTDDSEVHYLRAGSLEELTGDTALRKMWASPSELASYGVRQGDPIVAEGGDVGRSAFVPVVPEGTIIQNSLHRIRPRDGDVRFLKYALDSIYTSGWLDVLCNKATFGHLTREKLVALSIPWPPNGQQRAIADFLDDETARIDALIAKKRKLVRLLEARFQREIDHVMDSFDSSEAALGRFVLELGQGSSLQAGSRPADGEEWGVLKLSAVKFGRYDPRENKILAKQPEELPMVPQVGDLLVTRSNTPAYVGDVAAVVHTTARRMLPDLIYRLRLDSARMSAEFVSYALLTSRSRHRISALARGSSQSMVKLRGEDIRSLPVPVVTPSVQERTVASLERRRRQKSEISSKLDQQIALLVEHRQALITAAVTGEIGVPEVAVLHGSGR